MSEALIRTQFWHSPQAAAELLHPRSSPVSAVRCDQQESVHGCCRALILCGSLHTGKLLTTSLFSLLLCLCGCLSLSLLHSGNTTSQGMFQHATNSRTWCMSLLLNQRGRSRGSERGETQKKNPAWLSLLYLVSIHSFYFEYFEKWKSRCLKDWVSVWHGEVDFFTKAGLIYWQRQLAEKVWEMRAFFKLDWLLRSSF